MKFRLEEVEVPAGDPFKFDALKRQPAVEFVRDLIKKLEGPFVLALDSPWGTGKTTVVRMLRAALEVDGYRSVYFNAWKVDYVSDPLVPLVSAIDELTVTGAESESTFREHMTTIKNVVTAVAKRGVVAAVKAATLNALDLDEAMEEVAASATGDLMDDLVGAFQKEKASLERFRDALEKAVDEIADSDPARPLVFFIDELDRCRPSFAIELLERVKHLFDVKNIVFVLSIDKSQLEAITAAVYGERIDAPEYLRRFIDLEFALPVPHTKQYTRVLLERFGFKDFFDARRKYSELQYEVDNFVEAFTLLSGLFDLSLRARERCLTRLTVVLTQTRENEYLDPIVVAFLLVLRAKRSDLYVELISGELAPQDLVSMIRKLPGGREFSQSRISTIIECYLIVGDPVRDRPEETFKVLQKLAETEPDTERGAEARQLLDMRKYVPAGSFRRDFSLKSLANKIDLASRLGDE